MDEISRTPAEAPRSPGRESQPGGRAASIGLYLAAVSLTLPAMAFTFRGGAGIPGAHSPARAVYAWIAFAALLAALLGPLFGIVAVVRSGGRAKAWLVLGVSVVCGIIAVPLSFVIGMGSAWGQ